MLYGIVNTLELLVAIDTTTGLATAVGTIAWDTGVYFGNVPDMSFDSTGNLYVWREPCDDDLYRVDKTTAVATRVGEAGVGTAAVGLAFDSTDTLYMKTSNTLYTVDTTTGATSFQVSASFGVRLVNMLAFDESDVLYTGSRNGAQPLVTLDVATGAVTEIGPTGIPFLSALAFQPILNENEPPVADAGPDQTVECTGTPLAGCATVTLNGAPPGTPGRVTRMATRSPTPGPGLIPIPRS